MATVKGQGFSWAMRDALVRVCPVSRTHRSACPLQPGQTLVTDCQECTCDGTSRTLICRPQPCPLPPACPAPGLVPVPMVPQAGQCCPTYSCSEFHGGVCVSRTQEGLGWKYNQGPSRGG